MKSNPPRNRWRPWVQWGSIVGLNVSAGSWSRVQAKGVCLPVINCHSCTFAVFGCPIGMLSHYAGYRIFPALLVGMLLLAAALVGRWFCGWVCPFGTLQDWLHRIPTRKRTLPHWASWIKFAVLGLMVVLFPFLWGELTRAAFCRWCPPSALQVTLPGWISGSLAFSPSMAIKLGIAVSIFAAAIWVSRIFCRMICPIGALMAVSNHFSLWRVGPLKASCSSCRRCRDRCPTEVAPYDRLSVGRPANRHIDCVVCHECTSGCPREHPPVETPASAVPLGEHA